ncbi:hypothetical protein [Micromonospora olivasterospora]|uniref:hypothetical protein n=1 Tax=Micromonospora olivasterospora TaxID=1880 RepID=UPI0011A5F83B|nr:hypothetical protein [Micromonospora olivasterospora]
MDLGRPPVLPEFRCFYRPRAHRLDSHARRLTTRPCVYGTVGVCNDPAFLEQILTTAGAQNASHGYDNPKIKELLDSAKRAADPTERKKLYRQLGELVLTEAPIVGLAWRSQAYGYKKAVTGFSNIPGFLTFESGYTLAGTAKA